MLGRVLELNFQEVFNFSNLSFCNYILGSQVQLRCIKLRYASGQNTRRESRGPSCSSERPQLSIQHLQPHPRPANPPTCPSTRIQPSQCLPHGKPPVSRTLRSAAIGPPDTAIDTSNSYNRYIAVASRVVRRSLKEDARIIAERRGVSELRFAKWEVSRRRGRHWIRGGGS